MHFNPDIIVKCYPELPGNVTIDEDNNIIVTERISFTFSLLNERFRTIKIGDMSFDIPIDQLFMRPFQTYVLKNQGISKIVENDIHSVEEKADIIIRIIFE